MNSSSKRQASLAIGLTGFAVAVFALATVLSSAIAAAQAKRNTPATTAIEMNAPGVDTALFREYKGVHLGMTAAEVRGKLGEPKDKSADQDFFAFSESEMAQVFYDKSQIVTAMAINYLGPGSSGPPCKDVFGSDIAPKPDGSVFKLVRYPKEGFWVSYNRSGGDAPLLTLTVQKIPR